MSFVLCILDNITQGYLGLHNQWLWTFEPCRLMNTLRWAVAGGYQGTNQHNQPKLCLCQTCFMHLSSWIPEQPDLYIPQIWKSWRHVSFQFHNAGVMPHFQILGVILFGTDTLLGIKMCFCVLILVRKYREKSKHSLVCSTAQITSRTRIGSCVARIIHPILTAPSAKLFHTCSVRGLCFRGDSSPLRWWLGSCTEIACERHH